MSGYKGQTETVMNGSPFDGKHLYTEDLRSRFNSALQAGTVDGSLIRVLIKLAHQQPYPSHQAAHNITTLRLEGLVPDYDSTIAKAWEHEYLGNFAIAQELIDSTGVKVEIGALDQSS
ncbi:MAG: hypothetical protein M3Q36_00345 [bacterium]|nr:hypothetical protein [bacterium]